MVIDIPCTSTCQCVHTRALTRTSGPSCIQLPTYLPTYLPACLPSYLAHFVHHCFVPHVVALNPHCRSQLCLLLDLRHHCRRHPQITRGTTVPAPHHGVAVAHSPSLCPSARGLEVAFHLPSLQLSEHAARRRCSVTPRPCSGRHRKRRHDRWHSRHATH